MTCNRSVICDGGLVVGLAPTDAEWANTINKAGRQLTLSQKMTNEFLLVALGIDPDENTRKMQATIGLFGATLQDLMLGNSSSQILAAPTKNALSYLQNQVQPAYAAMASFLMDNVGTSAGSKLYVPCLPREHVAMSTQCNIQLVDSLHVKIEMCHLIELQKGALWGLGS